MMPWLMSDNQAAVGGSAVDLPGGATSGVERHQDALVQPQGDLRPLRDRRLWHGSRPACRRSGVLINLNGAGDLVLPWPSGCQAPGTRVTAAL
jgi:hypothetical protein